MAVTLSPQMARGTTHDGCAAAILVNPGARGGCQFVDIYGQSVGR